MKRILVGVDGSEVSKGAARFAASLARATGAEVRLACSIEPPTLYGPDPTGQITVEQYETAVENARTALAEAAMLMADEGVTATTVSLEGPAADALAKTAAGEVDLVVVGHRSRSAVTRAVLGSVADRLSQICPKPVLVFRQPEPK